MLGLVRPDGGTDVVWTWLKERELSRDAANAALRLLKTRMDDLCPGGTPVVVDVRRGVEVRPARRGWRTNYDAWLRSEAAGTAALWDFGQAS